MLKDMDFDHLREKKAIARKKSIALQVEIVAGRKCCLKNLATFATFSSTTIYFFPNSHLLPPATHTLRVIIEVLPLISFLMCFAMLPPPPTPTRYSNPPPTVYYFFEFVRGKISFSFTLTDIHARYSQILLVLLTLIVVWGQFLHSEVRQIEFQLGCSNSILSIFSPRLSNIRKNSTPPVYTTHPCLLSIWVNSKLNVYSLHPPSPRSIRAVTV